MPKELDDDGSGVATESKPKQKLKKPKLFKVILHNDNYTTMEFVIEVLTRVFHKTEFEATQLMLDVHTKGSAVAAVHPYEVAETKVAKVAAMAQAEGFPLLCTTEPE